ncbi:PsbP-related protein [Crocosphaera sp.]|uniref:PsbP-related protein n=1 Tax=Crocosphaera sp. TaxID=2729996 RepID=UPI00260411C9|nr:PsbP-related protein [Crocosphaera sp.]MDJ0581841.1 PsbP-related protein [Crocosphaera sp.]
MFKTSFKLSAIIGSAVFLSLFPAVSPLVKTSISSAQSQNNFKTHSVDNKFSIQTPQNYTVEKTPSNIPIWTFWSSKNRNNNNNLIKTEVSFFPQRFNDVVPPSNQRTIEGPITATITKRGNLTIDNKPAVRLWVAGEDTEFHFGNEIRSYIRYSNNTTVVIVSYYGNNPNAVDTIQRIHWSFRSL